jgi:hypothetical protein
MATSTLPRLLTASDVAAWLLLTPRAIERMAREGTIPTVELPDGSHLYDPTELVAWLDTRRTWEGRADE